MVFLRCVPSPLIFPLLFLVFSFFFQRLPFMCAKTNIHISGSRKSEWFLLSEGAETEGGFYWRTCERELGSRRCMRGVSWPFLLVFVAYLGYFNTPMYHQINCPYGIQMARMYVKTALGRTNSVCKCLSNYFLVDVYINSQVNLYSSSFNIPRTLLSEASLGISI